MLVITIIVCVVLAVLALCTANWGKPQRDISTIEADHVARSAVAWKSGSF